MAPRTDGEARIVQTQVEEPPSSTEPGPRLARTLAEQAAATEAKAARRRRTIGIVIVLVGLAVAAYAAWSFFTADDSNERKVGKLTASHLDGEAGSKVAAPTSKGSGSAKPTTPASTGSASNGGGTSTATVPPVATKPHWPAVVAGRPTAFGKLNDAPPSSAGDLEDGLYVWTDFDGWHLWLVGGGSDDGATITADYEIAKFDGTGGSVDADAEGNLLTFSRGSADGDVVGVDFSPGIYTKTMVITVDGDLPMHLGKRAREAASYYGVALTTT